MAWVWSKLGTLPAQSRWPSPARGAPASEYQRLIIEVVHIECVGNHKERARCSQRCSDRTH